MVGGRRWGRGERGSMGELDAPGGGGGGEEEEEEKHKKIKDEQSERRCV